MYHKFVLIYHLPLILWPNENLVQILSNDMLYDMFNVPYSQVLLPSIMKFYKIWLKFMAMHNGQNFLHNVINLCIHIPIDQPTDRPTDRLTDLSIYLSIYIYILRIVPRIESYKGSVTVQRQLSIKLDT